MKTYEYHTLTVFLFQKILNEKDVTHLYKGPKEEITDSILKQLNLAWREIIYVFLDAKGDKTTKDKFTTLIDLLEMEKEHSTIRAALHLLPLAEKKEAKERIVVVLKKHNQKIDINEKIEPQLLKIERYLKILSTNIRQKKLDNRELFKKVTKKIKMDVFEEAALLNKAIDIRLNPMTTLLPEWVAHFKLLKHYGGRS